MTKKVNTVLIASGSGTDADSIMKAYAAGSIPNINLVALISTKPGAGCLDKAKALGVPTEVLNRRNYNSIENFNKILGNFLMELKAQLVFLVGCVVKIFPIDGIRMYNIHPADPHQFNGNKMYGQYRV
jgi:phosphoribosylglycinamide formyltransferase 1